MAARAAADARLRRKVLVSQRLRTAVAAARALPPADATCCSERLRDLALEARRVGGPSAADDCTDAEQLIAKCVCVLCSYNVKYVYVNGSV